MALKEKVTKSVGANWEIECNRETCDVTLYFKKKKKKSYHFDKFYQAITFFARIKKVKDIDLSDHYAFYYSEF